MSIKIQNNRIYFNDGSYIESANINPGDGMASGTRMFFYQTTAPTGWTKDTTYNNAALRVINGTVSNYTGGMAFTSAFSNSRTPSGTITVNILEHTTSTNSSSSGITIQSANVTGLSLGTPTINNSAGTEDVTVDFQVATWNPLNKITSGSATITGSVNIHTTTPGIPSHNHTLNNQSPSLVYNYSIVDMKNEITWDAAVNLVTLNDAEAASWGTTNTNTGDYVNGTTTHEHGNGTVAFVSSGSHTHYMEPTHNHSSVIIDLPQHSHSNSSISGSFDNSGSHTHNVSANSHSHTLNLTHSASGSFTGIAMPFNVNYVDVIIAQKD